MTVRFGPYRMYKKVPSLIRKFHSCIDNSLQKPVCTVDRAWFEIRGQRFMPTHSRIRRAYVMNESSIL